MTCLFREHLLHCTQANIQSYFSDMSAKPGDWHAIALVLTAFVVVWRELIQT